MRTRHGARWLLVTVTLLCVEGCVSTKTIPLAGSFPGEWTGKSIALVQRPLPAFAVMSSGKVALGALLGPAGMGAMGAAMAREGARLEVEDHLQDPAVAIGQSLLTELVAADHLRAVDGVQLTRPTGSTAHAIALPATDLLLDVRTVGWQAMYFPTDWNRYGILYSVRLTLTDARGDIIAQGFCVHHPQKTADSPTHDELLSDWGQRLKALSRKSGDFCLQDLRHKLFGGETAVAAHD